ncbi:arginyltransferase [Pacificimonas flava]|uniref:Aspartate/glutamate leucyltransferase n=2 Tax=Pacificimonas TaxID=1960290 RepID=A0A219B3L2_9SPHN|nr:MULTISPECIES: arginyltransferase [Pacificimonas]MBZ6377923.1 arginyltransferase [Pacificimonas aurantium]OWV32419.1 arginyltransferase [Pacificimonas flava]
MTDQSFRFPRFFVTAPSPCPYLPGRTERKVFTELRGSDAAQLSEALSRIGFRRSQNVVYRPSCDGCRLCVSVRVLTREFKPSSSQRRILRQHDDLVVDACPPRTTSEQFALLRRYLDIRHPDGGMASMDAYDYADMVEQTPVDTVILEYREAPEEGKRLGRLVGVCLTDRQSDGLSMVYSFYEPELERRKGLGNFIILDHIRRAAEAGLPYVYLGYWIDGCDRMNYKYRFKPLEALTPAGWERRS